MRSETVRLLGEKLGPVSAAIGTIGFEQALAALIGDLLPHDMMTVARYSDHHASEIVAHSASFPEHMLEKYGKLYGTHDPYAAYWREHGPLQVVTLNDVATAQKKFERYIREFLFDNGIRDEIGVFLPPLAGSSLAIFCESAQRRYGKREKLLLQDIYPLLANLYRAHLIALFASPPETLEPSSAANDALLVTTAQGEPVWSTRAWQRLAPSTRKNIREHIAAPGPERTANVPVDGGGMLVADNLGGSGDRIVWALRAPQPSGPAENALDVGTWTFDQNLTPRERDVVTLILQGYPTSLIADRLGLSRGTVKNHRRRIYERLDITTERELFLMYIEAAIGPAGAS